MILNLIAMAIGRVGGLRPESFNREAARAALTALLELDESMIESAGGWRAVIEAALR